MDAEVEIGTPASLISDMAKRVEADFIVMGTRGEHNALEKIWGSVTTAVIEHAHCPVWVVPEHAPYSNIAIAAYATDLDEADP
ncbi:universal stress protein, partial [Arthrospira platensis SPKY1]|nr:universal stress protein [Arthrospira platensis SPKY1]